MSKDRYIEHSFPIVQLNPLSVHERNAFKPIYKMHKWFARRSSSIFRAILLAAALPYTDEKGKPIDLMKEFYKGHGDDLRLRRPDGSRLRVLDPFMGGGTTIVEALRLGFDVTGVDYNPIAWLIVKGETTAVDLGELDSAYQRVADKVKDELLDLYKTKCPVTGKDADIIYGFWVKQGICVNPECGAKTDLFKSYIVARKRGDATIKYAADVMCPHCKNVFDWEFERASITAGGPQVQGEAACGNGRPKGSRYAFGSPSAGVKCPFCKKKVRQNALGNKHADKKRTELHVVWDPVHEKLFEVRGRVPKEVHSPFGRVSISIEPGIVQGGKFMCGTCGRKQEIVDSARRHGSPLPFRYYAFYGYSVHAEGGGGDERGLAWNGGKWFGTVVAYDRSKIRLATEQLKGGRIGMLIPNQEISDGYNTNRLVIHQYARWGDPYGERQKYALGRLLEAIGAENGAVRDALLGAFQATLNYQSFLCRYNVARSQVEGVQASHDYRNPTTAVESPVWGAAQKVGRGSFSNYYENLTAGLRYQSEPDLLRQDLTSVRVDDCVGATWAPRLFCRSSTDLGDFTDRWFDLIVTDPPYAGSVQYSEMSDWSYVWLCKVLGQVYCDSFGSETTLKAQEIIENGADKDPAFFFAELTKAWKECHRILADDGLLVFTFHHAEGDRWTGLLTSLFDAGFYLVAAYPTHSEALNSIVIQATKGITYDIIHVCRKRLTEPESIPWTTLRREVRKQAQKQLKEIEQGKDVLPGPDVRMILIGRALMMFSRHYGKVLGSDNKPMDLDAAMEGILQLVREVRGEKLPLPEKLQNVDTLTQSFLLHVVGKQGWVRDDLHKDLRGYKHGLKELVDTGIVRAVKGAKGKLEPVPPLERYRGGRLSKQAGGPLVDKIHLLLGTIDDGLSIEPLMDAWRGQWDQISEALSWMAKHDSELRDAIGLARRQIEALGPEGAAKKAGQMALPLIDEDA